MRQRAAATKAAQEAVDKAARAQADVAAKTQADVAAAATGEVLREQRRELVIPLRAVVPAPEVSAVSSEGAGDDQLVMEREGCDVVAPEMEMIPPAPTAMDQGGRPNAPPMPPATGEDLVVQSPARQRAGKAASTL